MAVVADTDEQLERGRDAMRPAPRVLRLDSRVQGDPRRARLGRPPARAQPALEDRRLGDDERAHHRRDGRRVQRAGHARRRSARSSATATAISCSASRSTPSAQLDPDTRGTRPRRPRAARRAARAARARSRSSVWSRLARVTSSQVTCTTRHPAASIAASRARSRFQASREPWCSNPSHSHAIRIAGHAKSSRNRPTGCWRSGAGSALVRSSRASFTSSRDSSARVTGRCTASSRRTEPSPAARARTAPRHAAPARRRSSDPCAAPARTPSRAPRRRASPRNR